MSLMTDQIERLFKNHQQAMKNGLWFSGIEGEGEYKDWYKNNQIRVHCFYKDGNKDGEYKIWYDNGQIWVHCFYKDGEKDGYKSCESDKKRWI
jgi:antitoxin component YwqK of YwqJK toxin-antitoxin module